MTAVRKVVVTADMIGMMDVAVKAADTAAENVDREGRGAALL